MPPARNFVIGPVPSTESDEAFSCHVRLAASDPHVFPRTAMQIEAYARNGELFGVREGASGELVGLVYAILDESGTPAKWEIGGLTVDPAYQGCGLGMALVTFALAHTLTIQSPWAAGQVVVAHVHEANQSPRKIFDRLTFRYDGQVTLPGKIAPASMKRNTAGDVVGDELWFEKPSIPALIRHLDWGARGKLRNGDGIAVDARVARTVDIGRMVRVLEEISRD